MICRAELVDRVAGRTGLPKAAVRVVIQAWLTEAVEQLVAGNRVTLGRLGVLSPRFYAKARLGFGDERGPMIRPSFRPSKELRRRVRALQPEDLT